MNDSTYSIIRAGLRALKAEHSEREVAKLGVLRAGSTGIVLSDGAVAGKCARQTYLRLEGIDADELDESREFMFAAGRSNEDIWVELLVRGGIPRDHIKREDEVPISWTTKSGRLVSGRPDIVLGRPNDAGVWTPYKGLELKLVSSLWSARDVALKGEPKSMHLMQAAHYFWKLGVPAFELWYTSRADFAIPFGKFWPNPGEKGSEYLVYKNGKALKLVPFKVGYELRWSTDGVDRLEFKRVVETGGMPYRWQGTIITKKGIEDYFELVDAIANDLSDELPPRPENLTATGELGNYSICDYCPLSQVCDKREDAGKAAWVKAVKEWVPMLPTKGSLK